jgi:hypothetical protein
MEVISNKNKKRIMTKPKKEYEKKYQKNYIECLSCKKTFHRCKSLIKSENNFCSIECKGSGMSLNLTKPMRKGTGLYDNETPLIRRKYYKYKIRDNNKFKTELDFSIEEFIKMIKEGQCFYCGLNDNSLGLDRIDNKLGHIKSNIVVCCFECNMTRGDRWTHEEMILIGETIKKIKNKRKDEKNKII